MVSDIIFTYCVDFLKKYRQSTYEKSKLFPPLIYNILKYTHSARLLLLHDEVWFAEQHHGHAHQRRHHEELYAKITLCYCT